MRKINANGFSLVEVLISLGIISIGMMVMAEFTLSQTKSQKRIVQKYELIELKNNISSALEDPSLCLCMLPNILNSTVEMSLNSIKDSCVASAAPLVSKNDFLPGTQTGIKISDIKIKKMTLIGTDLYTADIVIIPDPGSLVMSLMPAKSSIIIKTQGANPAALTVSACSSAASMPSFDINQVCLYLNGSLNPTTGKCQLPYNSAPPGPAPSGNIVAHCDTRVISYKCFGGAKPGKICPPGSTVSNEIQSVLNSSFDCIAN
ncbi:MAG: type IV pilus modification PilV family protein [Pseudobdellovibrionaceae bacterium]